MSDLSLPIGALYERLRSLTLPVLHRRLLTLLVLFLSFLSCSPRLDSTTKPEKLSEEQGRITTRHEAENPCVAFDRLNTLIRDGKVEKQIAHGKIAELLPKLSDYFYAKGGTDSPVDQWVFPLEGYTIDAIGGTSGNGYIAKGYEYFDGNRHGGHPAQDIFIRDRNQDSLDDRTGRPVNVLSMRNGVVVASESTWSAGSELRGGKYLYVFDPAMNSLIYYAHNREIFVKPGDIVTAGQVIASVGRTGKNASATRSPTHLHLMWLVFDDGAPTPRNIFQHLLKAKVGIKS